MKEENSVEVREIFKTFTVSMILRKSDANTSIFHRKNIEERVILNGISFEIKKGESMGILGRNGSGKSTILKMLAKVMYPDAGEIEIKGKVVSILELGMGFHPEFSGRENIYIKGSMYGLSEKDVDSIIDDIIDFSELGDRIDDPVRVYSSGMYARLAFAIAIKIKSDVVIIDEILSVGDIGFRSKCSMALKDVKKRGTTIIMASHSMGTIEDMCDRVIWIDSGKVREIGESSVVCYHFEKDLMDSFDAIKASAESGDVISQNNLGVMYRDGRNVETNIDEASKWFKKAAESGSSEAQLNLGELILQRNNAEEYREEALLWFIRAADAGNMNAQLRLSEIQSGDREDDDWKSAFEFLKHLAEKGNLRAQATLANVFFNGIGIQKDQKSAFFWYTKSAENGDPASKYQLGIIYRDGLGTEKDLDKAVEWLKFSANCNYMRARIELANMYRKGIGVERNLLESLKWYKEAANSGDANSIYQVAVMYRDGIGTDADTEEANRWFSLFSKQGRLGILNTLGEICRFDIDVHDTASINYYEQSAKNGNLNAEYITGMLMKDFAIINSDGGVATNWFKKAAEKGHVNAQMELGHMLLRGIGIKKDPETAFMLFEKAANSGNHVARYLLGNLYYRGIGTEKNIEKARDMYRLASEQGNNNARLALLKMNKNRLVE